MTEADKEEEKKKKKKKKKTSKKEKDHGSDDGGDDGDDEEMKSPPKIKKKKKEKKKTSKKEKDHESDDDGDDGDDGGGDEEIESPKVKKKKKEKKKTSKKEKDRGSDDDGDDGDDGGGDEEIESSKVKKKKKEKKKTSKKEKDHGSDDGSDDSDGGDESSSADNRTDTEDEEIESPKVKKKKKEKKKTSKKEKDHGSDDGSDDSDGGGDESSSTDDRTDTEDLAEVLADTDLQPRASVSSKPILNPDDYDKYSVEYFQATLEEIRTTCEQKLKLKTKDKDDFATMCANFYETWTDNEENDRWLAELVEGKNSKRGGEQLTTEQLVEEQTRFASELTKALLKRKKACIKSAMKVFMGLKEDSMNGIEEKLVQGAVIAQATPEKLADFAAHSNVNERLIKRLFSNHELMKDMLLHGGAVKYEYGNAIRIFAGCMKKNKSGSSNDDDDDKDDSKWTNVNYKIALACALEHASPIYEFDSMVPVDPVARYQHFVDAHKEGELDPSFPFFTVWEMRQIVNCDAPNDQMSWCRKMVMSYVPHLTCLTDVSLRYVYMLQSDVRLRKPEWTGSPRTYPMVLSGGGNESINSWFGRFLLKSFGLPSWGAKFRRKEGYTRWTPEGWKALNGVDWDNCSWKGKSGKDFKTEVEARNKAPQEEYFKRLVTLHCLADIVDDGDPSSIPDNEKDVLHPDRMWRSMSIVSMELLFQTEPEVKRSFERKGDGLVVTNCEKYLEKFQNDTPDDEISYEDGVLTVPASRHSHTDGNIMAIESFKGTKQLNFVSGGDVEYELPDDIPSKMYTLTCYVCTVSSKQVPLLVKYGDGNADDDTVEIQIPYTKGEWKTTNSVRLEIKGGSILRLSRPNGALGLAVKKLVLYKVP